jgi:hypothetical protein
VSIKEVNFQIFGQRSSNQNDKFDLDKCSRFEQSFQAVKGDKSIPDLLRK